MNTKLNIRQIKTQYTQAFNDSGVLSNIYWVSGSRYITVYCNISDIRLFYIDNKEKKIIYDHDRVLMRVASKLTPKDFIDGPINKSIDIEQMLEESNKYIGYCISDKFNLVDYSAFYDDINP